MKNCTTFSRKSSDADIYLDDGSDNDDTTETEDNTTSTPDYEIDYYDAASFENALITLAPERFSLVFKSTLSSRA